MVLFSLDMIWAPYGLLQPNSVQMGNPSGQTPPVKGPERVVQRTCVACPGMAMTGSPRTRTVKHVLLDMNIRAALGARSREHMFRVCASVWMCLR